MRGRRGPWCSPRERMVRGRFAGLSCVADAGRSAGVSSVLVSLPHIWRVRFLFLVLYPLLPPPPPPASRLPPTNCHQPIVISQLLPTNCHQPIATNPLPPRNCHQPIATNNFPPTHCHQPTATNKLLPTKLSPTDHQLSAPVFAKLLSCGVIRTWAISYKVRT